MSQKLLPGSILSLSAQAADRLLSLDNGDAALLYLHLLRHPDASPPAWPAGRYQAALALLTAQGLASEASPAPVPPPPDLPPDYSLEEVTAALNDTSPFSALCDEVERRLGKKLSAADLRILLTLYDHLALPAEVILMLVTWCTGEVQRKYGSGRRPFLSQIRREGFAWAQRGVDSVEAAEEHIKCLTLLRSREQEVLRLLNIAPRPLVERERSYIAAWDEMGFDDEALYLAYEQTVLKKQSMNWAYMNAILRRWHEKGWHSAQAVRQADSGIAGRRAYRQPEPEQRDTEGEERRHRENLERTRRLLQRMKEEGN